MPKASKVKKSASRKTYVLPLKFNPEEFTLLETLEKRRGIVRSTLLKSYMYDDANRLGIPIPEK